MIFLRGNTASQEVPLGYFVDSTDGNTEETGLTIANTDIKVWKAGATTLANKNSGGGTHISNGIYYATLDATDTNTYGPLKIFVHVSGALACALECCVLAEPVYDSFFPVSAGTPLPVFGILDWGTAQASASGTLVHRSGLSWANDIPNGGQAIIYSGTGAGQTRFIYDFTGASDTSNISPAWTTTPSTDSLYVVAGGSPAPTDAAATPTVNTVYVNGTQQTARDLGASVLLSPGTGTGQVNLSSGAVPVTGDFTATMKTSIGTAVAASAVASVTGAVGSVTGAVGSVTGNVGGNVVGSVGSVTGGATQASLNATRYAKNTASQKVYFTLVDSTDHVTRKTGITVTAQRSLDGAAFGSATGTVTEVGSGVYYLSTSTADINADDVVFRFTGTACDPVELHVVTY
jgi:hypothetical protein